MVASSIFVSNPFYVCPGVNLWLGGKILRYKLEVSGIRNRDTLSLVAWRK